MRACWASRLLPALATVFVACGPTVHAPCEQHETSNLGVQWIGIKTDAAVDSGMTCAETIGTVAGWTAEALFIDANGVAASGPLGRYCLYKNTAFGSREEPRLEGAPSGDLTCAAEPKSAPAGSVVDFKLALAANVTDLTQDVAVISAQTSQQQSLGTVRRYMRERTHQATGSLDTNVLPFVQRKSKHYISTAILDSAPSEPDGIGPRAGMVKDIDRTNEHHGSLMAFLANDVPCPKSDANSTTGECGVRTHTVLALPLRTPDAEDHENGGHFGRRSDLARALYQTVVTYRDRFTAMKGEDARLVISLSLAWEPDPSLSKAPESVCAVNPEAGGKDSASLAVREVLTFASCHGATVIAAAGNYAGDSSGRMCPADFERVTLPDPKACGEWVKYDKKVNGVTTTVSFAEDFQAVFPGARLDQPIDKTQMPSFRRIVYAVGGIVPRHDGSADDSLAPARPGSRPRFLAMAEGGTSTMGPFFASATTGGPAALDEPPRSGTSVAAANLAGIVAGLLATNPLLTPPVAMFRLYNTGVHPAPASQPGPQGPTGAQGPTGLLVEACSEKPGDPCDVTEARRPMLCKAIGTCNEAPSGSAALASSTLSQAVTDLYAGTLGPSIPTEPIWPVLAKTFTSIAAQPWVIEQPVRGGCPDCTWSASEQQISVINPAWLTLPNDLSSVWFTVEIAGSSPVNISGSGAEEVLDLPSGTVTGVTMTAIDHDHLVVTQTIARVY